MKNNVVLILVFATTLTTFSQITDNHLLKKSLNDKLTQWHLAASEANYTKYFNHFASDARYIGTDASENWGLNEFMLFSKPYFDKGKAWDFKTLKRNIYISKNNSYAWFDELLNTWMGICRGSGILILENGQWKIQHYVLSISINNNTVKDVKKLNRKLDSTLVKLWKTK